METLDQGARAGLLLLLLCASGRVVSCCVAAPPRGLLLCVCSGPWPLRVAPGPPGEVDAVDMAEHGDETDDVVDAVTAAAADDDGVTWLALPASPPGVLLLLLLAFPINKAES